MDPYRKKRVEARKRRSELAFVKAVAFVLSLVTVALSVSLAEARSAARGSEEKMPEVEEVYLISYWQDTTKEPVPFEAITAVGTDQWFLQRSHMAYTDSDGFRRYSENGYYMVSVSQYFGRVGDLLIITMRNGSVFYALISDVKSEEPTSRSQILQFIVDEDYISDECRATGDMSFASPKFFGKIAKLENCGKIR